jgi:hypothetical protein
MNSSASPILRGPRIGRPSGQVPEFGGRNPDCTRLRQASRRERAGSGGLAVLQQGHDLRRRGLARRSRVDLPLRTNDVYDTGQAGYHTHSLDKIGCPMP